MEVVETYQKIDVPVFDLDGLYSDDPEILSQLAKRFLEATSDLGVVATINNGIPLELIPKIHGLCDTLFALPPETKKKYWRELKPSQGYYEAIFDIDGKPKVMQEFYEYITKDLKVGLPEEVPELVEVSEELTFKFNFMSERILKLLDIALGTGDSLKKLHNTNKERKDVSTKLKMIRYNKIPDTMAIGTLRIQEHYDFGSLTLLYAVEGLQVLDSDGVWKTANIPPGTILCQFGESLQRLTNDRLQALKHRVVVTEETKRHGGYRRSTVFFQGPKLDAIVEPLIGSNEKYKPATYDEIITERLKFYFDYK